VKLVQERAQVVADPFDTWPPELEGLNATPKQATQHNWDACVVHLRHVVSLQT
jgi:hypothetical protein